MDGNGHFAQQAHHRRRWVPHYDADTVGHLAPDPAVRFLHDVAGGGPSLELGIGRIALPVAGRGFSVSSIDASPDMIALLHEQLVDGRSGDMADFRPPAPFRFPLVYVAAGTFYLDRPATASR